MLRFTASVAVGLSSGGACGDKDAPAPPATATSARTCIPSDANAIIHMALTGTKLTFCLAARFDNPYCFTADLDAKTIASARAPAAFGNITRLDTIDGARPGRASIGPSPRGKQLTACTSDKTTCHDIPVDPATIGDKAMAVSDDATLVAIDIRRPRPRDTQKTPGRLETWDAVNGKKLASFVIEYGADGLGFDHAPSHIL